MTSHDIAVVLTAHEEGRLLVPTLRSLDAAVRSAARAGMSVQLVVVMDAADAETRRVLDVHLFAPGVLEADVVRLEVANGDLGASRNDGIARTTAPLIAIMDGDNLITSNWLVEGRAALAAHGSRAVAHVELIASFGERRTLWPQMASTDPRFDPSLFAVANYWDSSAIAHRDVFEAIPYPVLPPGNGYGPEDWAWNIATLESGVEHIRIPRTAMFYRARAGSLLAAHGASLLPPTRFLSDIDLARRFAARAVDSVARPSVTERIRAALPYSARRPLSIMVRATRSVLRPWVHGARRVAKRISPDPTAMAPAWLVPEWQAANVLEPAVPFLRTGTFDSYLPWGPPWSEWERDRAVAYWRILSELGGAVDYLFVAPWVKTGGGDRVLLQYIDAVRRSRPDARIALITTEADESTRLADVADDVVVVELRGHYSQRVDREWMVSRLLPQLLVQCPPTTMHVFNSTVGFDVVERYGRLLSQTTSIFLSTFVMDRTPDGERTSVLFYRHPRFLAPAAGVLVDSAAFIDTMVVENGFPREKFLLQRQIVPELPAVSSRREIFSAEAPFRLLWAGRFDLQKRLDILAEIARTVRERGLPVEIHFFGESVMGDPSLDSTLAALAAEGAVRHDAYEDIAELSLDQFDAYVMTSEWEGVPNLLLEIMSSGLPVIAPLVGGVPEVLDDEVGFPIRRFDDVSAYVDVVEMIIQDPTVVHRRAAAARARVHERYSSEVFDRALHDLPGYIGGLEPEEAQSEGPLWRFVADARTRDFLASTQSRVYLFSGSGGYSNFGDILQPKGVISQWMRDSPDVTPVVFFHVGSVAGPERLEQLRRWYGVEHIVFFADESDEIPAPFASVPRTRVTAPVHVVGGGFLNATWGPRYLSVIEAIGDVFDGTEYLFSGMQVDDFIIPHLVAFADRAHLVALGLRDDQSLAIARDAFGGVASPSFDDLFEVVDAWGRGRRIRERDGRPFRIGLHINASDYVGGSAVVDAVQAHLETVLTVHPDAEVLLLNAYPDRRPEVLDTLASLRLFGDAFPFTRFEVLDIAHVALEADVLSGEVPAAIRDLELDAAITCSYHTTMLMNALHVPAFLLRINDYYAQKAAVFELPDDFARFLAEPADYLTAFTVQRRERREWSARVTSWITGDGFPPAAGAKG